VSKFERLFTNRDDEMGLFVRMVHREDPPRILAVQAHAGYGKSWLIDRFEAWCRSEGVPCVRFDFDPAREGEPLSPELILEKASEPLGLMPANDLEAFARLLKEMGGNPATVEVGANAHITQSHFGDIANLVIKEMHVSLPGMDPTTRRRQATRRFRDALVACGSVTPAVWLIDTCEKADQNPDTADWLRGAILHHVARERKLPLVVVLAGRSIPLLSCDWEDCFCRILLEPFDMRQTRTLVCERIGLPLNSETVAFIHRVTEGVPQTVVQMVEKYASASTEAAR
jgi:hypothetical protein